MTGWVKSTFSNSFSNCVEVAPGADGMIVVRDRNGDGHCLQMVSGVLELASGCTAGELSELFVGFFQTDISGYQGYDMECGYDESGTGCGSESSPDIFCATNSNPGSNVTAHLFDSANEYADRCVWSVP